MTLKDQVKEFVRFDDYKFEHLELAREGAEEEHSRLAPLLNLLPEIVAALENECCCSGETSWTTSKPILCDTCETLAKIKEVVGGKI